MQTKPTHSDLVSALRKDGSQIQKELTPIDCDLLHMTIGVCGEAGELLEAVKKITIYRKAPDMANLTEELGDIEFFLEGIRQIVGIPREETLEANISKLAKRYHAGRFENSHAQERADKSPGQ